MERRTLKYVVEAVRGVLRVGDPEMGVCDVSTDSRKAGAGELFVALSGDRFDGHDYLAEVAGRGVGAVMVERGRELPTGWPREVGVVEVENTRVALGELAARYRRDFSPEMVVVAGSNGKTSTKEFLGTLLGVRGPVLRSEASFNNEIGVPLTLLRLTGEHWAAVLEVGTNHPGELAPLLQMVGPKLGVITSIGREHLEFFGDVEGVLAEEGTVAEMLPVGSGVLVLGSMEAGYRERLNRRAADGVRVVACVEGEGEGGGEGGGGGEERGVWRVGRVSHGGVGLEFSVTGVPEGASGEWLGEYGISLVGRHQALNAVLSLVVAVELGMSVAQVREGLAGLKPARRRLEWKQIGPVWILDDSYNANADSMLAALETWSELRCEGKRWAVLGDMAELGKHAAEAHREVGRAAGRVEGARVLAVGRYAAETVRGVKESGWAAAMELGGVEEILDLLCRELGPGDVVLVKASRSSGLDRVSDGLSTWAGLGSVRA